MLLYVFSAECHLHLPTIWNLLWQSASDKREAEPALRPSEIASRHFRGRLEMHLLGVLWARSFKWNFCEVLLRCKLVEILECFVSGPVYKDFFALWTAGACIQHVYGVSVLASFLCFVFICFWDSNLITFLCFFSFLHPPIYSFLLSYKLFMAPLFINWYGMHISICRHFNFLKEKQCIVSWIHSNCLDCFFFLILGRHVRYCWWIDPGLYCQTLQGSQCTG